MQSRFREFKEITTLDRISLSGSARSEIRILLTNSGKIVWTDGGKISPLQVMDYLLVPWERGSHVECVVTSICDGGFASSKFENIITTRFFHR